MTTTASTPLLSRDDLLRRIEVRWNATPAKDRHPLGLHCYPKNVQLPHWFGVGPVNWGSNDPPAWFDIRLADDRAYNQMNNMLRSVCQQLEIPYINMR